VPSCFIFFIFAPPPPAPGKKERDYASISPPTPPHHPNNPISSTFPYLPPNPRGLNSRLRAPVQRTVGFIIFSRLHRREVEHACGVAVLFKWTCLPVHSFSLRCKHNFVSGINKSPTLLSSFLSPFPYSVARSSTPFFVFNPLLFLHGVVSWPPPCIAPSFQPFVRIDLSPPS